MFRLRLVGTKLGWLVLGAGIGALLIFLSGFVYPIDEAIHDSRGMVGVVYGLLLGCGFFFEGVALYVLTGRGLMERLLD